MVQLIPLPLTVSCFSKIQIGFTFLVSAHLGSPGKRAIKRVCVCVRVYLVWLSVWSELQTCIWPSWCHCHALSLASVKSRLVLLFWYWLTRVVPEKGPLNGCVRVCVCAVASGAMYANFWTFYSCLLGRKTLLLNNRNVSLWTDFSLFILTLLALQQSCPGTDPVLGIPHYCMSPLVYSCRPHSRPTW